MSHHILAVLCLTVCLCVALPAHGATHTAAAQPEPDAAAVCQPQAFDCATVIEIPQGECQALVALWHATQAPTQARVWLNHTGWLANAMPCSWYGVSCLAGHVSRLELPKNEMDGTLPSALGDLGGLEVLNLSGNDLHGALPAELGRLTALRELLLGNNNQLTGFPPELGQLSALVRLDLSHNPLHVMLPPEVGHLSALQALNLAGNSLFGPLPPELSQLSALRQLNLSFNGFSGTLLPEFAQLRNLERLEIANNPTLSGTLPTAWGDLPNLVYLDLSHNRFDGPIPAEWGGLTNLTELRLNNSQRNGPIPATLGNLSRLSRLNLGSNNLSGEIPAELSNLENLRYLDLSNNQLSGPIPAQLGDLTALEDLYLDHNQLTGAIPPELGNLTNIRARWDWANQGEGVLRPPPPHGYLWLSSNRLSGPIPIELSKLYAAASIDLNCNQLSGDLPPAVGLAIFGTYVGDVYYNKLTGYDPILYPTWYWYDSQTVPPADLRGTANGSTITLTWTPIAYTGDGGFYEISYATTSTGPFVVHGQTADKMVGSYTLTDLTPGAAYTFRVRTFTPAHRTGCDQQSDLWSDYSAVVSASIPPVRLWLPLVWQ